MTTKLGTRAAERSDDLGTLPGAGDSQSTLFSKASHAQGEWSSDGEIEHALEEIERTRIGEGLRRTRWNERRLAKELGISGAGLRRKIHQYGLAKRRVIGAGT